MFDNNYNDEDDDDDDDNVRIKAHLMYLTS